MSKTEDTKITINVDSDEILEKIKKEKEDETVIKQDKLLFKLMMHNYDEEVRRNELIDSKNSQMIAFLGIMFTIQLTLFVNVLSTYLSKNAWPLSLKVSSCVLLIFALLFYVVLNNYLANIRFKLVLLHFYRFFLQIGSVFLHGVFRLVYLHCFSLFFTFLFYRYFALFQEQLKSIR